MFNKALTSLQRYTAFLIVSLLGLLLAYKGLTTLPWALAPAAVLCSLGILGLYDLFQKGHSVLRNYPVIGHLRYLLEAIRPEIRQYLLENDNDEHPFSREARGLVYQRAKAVEDTGESSCAL